MSQKPPTRVMRENPDIDQLKRQAKELLEAYRASSPEAVAEVTAYHRTATPETFALHDAQFVLARSYGFESWPKLKAAVDGVTAAQITRGRRERRSQDCPRAAHAPPGDCGPGPRRNAGGAHGRPEARSRDDQAAARIWSRPGRRHLAQAGRDRPVHPRTRARLRRDCRRAPRRS